MAEFEDKRICFISFISRDDKPLYIQSFDLDTKQGDTINANNFLKYNFLSHMALDIITSPASISIREQQQEADVRNGAVLLVVYDDVSVYGYESNTGLKIIIGFNNQTHLNQEESKMVTLRTLFLSVHKAYVKTICNPFLEIDSSGDIEGMLQNEVFDKSIKKIVNDWNDA
ncbi:hypothetical protein PSN45_004538 [Yamadazyma tenuis]|uniref:Snare-like protein n=1 Tax=Candida tenuis (strain ATCC 10573 / BCRC 21748 / CBS 615 / JCM 9827 / NBRC 10315 / NRRL Y-1498 / VKM Y-70) TaxID=590646 RepID=G3B5C5_CANTC|nr:snare-like protein [Yamadazyma tenuis ATCC 10573]XP_006687372.1 uncharacterized protein CANTEDRAFT_114503 [Yamadazyma tenuis ATCC 10573]EGV63578.1 snare-like protein [Yamadazyma tenuis ATCC 10573]EGV63579.1 hypothetical protein CANTEDRAFT_114503 [Yamadazyma tenuis ATCC 10573]WEJ96992.1 hypothetical protein PSN45_004538 [Yamadazyma tenuis]